MTPEQRDRYLYNRSMEDSARAERIRVARECAKAVCLLCRTGMAFAGEYHRTPIHGERVDCDAIGIRVAFPEAFEEPEASK